MINITGLYFAMMGENAKCIQHPEFGKVCPVFHSIDELEKFYKFHNGVVTDVCEIKGATSFLRRLKIERVILVVLSNITVERDTINYTADYIT